MLTPAVVSYVFQRGRLSKQAICVVSLSVFLSHGLIVLFDRPFLVFLIYFVVLHQYWRRWEKYWEKKKTTTTTTSKSTGYEKQNTLDAPQHTGVLYIKTSYSSSGSISDSIDVTRCCCCDCWCRVVWCVLFIMSVVVVVVVVVVGWWWWCYSVLFLLGYFSFFANSKWRTFLFFIEDRTIGRLSWRGERGEENNNPQKQKLI